MHSISDDEDDDDDIDDYLDEYEMIMVKPVKLVMVMMIVPKKTLNYGYIISFVLLNAFSDALIRVWLSKDIFIHSRGVCLFK